MSAYRELGEQGEVLQPAGIEPEKVEFKTPLQEVINEVGRMKLAGIPPHTDGYYHAVLTFDSLSKFFGDPIFQRLNVGLPKGVGPVNFIGHLAGITFRSGKVDSITGGEPQ